jgi:hypothetical protein
MCGAPPCQRILSASSTSVSRPLTAWRTAGVDTWRSEVMGQVERALGGLDGRRSRGAIAQLLDFVDFYIF